MTIKGITSIKSFFESGDRPTQSDFTDFIDSTMRPTLTTLATSVENLGRTGITNVTAAGFGFETINSAGRTILAQGDMNAVKTLTWQLGGTYTVLTLGTANTVLTGGSVSPSYGKVTEDRILLGARVAGGIVAHNSAANITVISPASSDKVLAGQGPGAVPAYIDMYQYIGSFSVSSNEITCTGIPSWANRVVVCLNGVSNTANDMAIQLGHSGGFISTGYVGVYGHGGGETGGTTGFILDIRSSNANGCYGVYTFQRGASNVWFACGTFAEATVAASYAAGMVDVTATLTQIKITNSGAGNLDAGTIQVWAYR